MLRFVKTTDKRKLKNLGAEVSETSQTVYLGEIEFGHLFKVQTRSGEFWRWELRFPLLDATIGEAPTEGEAKEIFLKGYNLLSAQIAADAQIPQAA
jgi:hypothetical protein